jgi:hypothetical protein
MYDINPEVLARREVDDRGVAPDEGEELQLRQPLEQRARESDPLADRDHAVGVPQALDQLIEVACRFTKSNDLVPSQQLEALQPVHNILIIVRNRYAHGCN